MLAEPSTVAAAPPALPYGLLPPPEAIVGGWYSSRDIVRVASVVRVAVGKGVVVCS